jgi:CubicO group peptidase (beta-lactamase class C family)
MHRELIPLVLTGAMAIVAADLKVSTTYDLVSTTDRLDTATAIAAGAVVVPTFRSAEPKARGARRSAALKAPGLPALDAAATAAAELPRLHSLLVSQRGSIILERYFNRRRETSPANVKSVSKSVIAALVGVAVDSKLLSLDQPITKYFPDLPESKRAITIEDLLTMRSGLESTSSRNYGAWVQSSNWVRHALARPLVAAPGTQMIYSTGNTHILSAILTKATGRSTWQFAQEMLAKPLGFSLAPWVRDPQGIYFGGNEMVMTPRQMLAFGEMYRNGGQVSGRRILSKAFVDETFQPRGRSRISGREYGYGWWIREMAGRTAYYAWGFGGQYIVLVPSLDLTVVSTSAATVSEDRRDHRRTVEEIIEHLIVARLES